MESITFLACCNHWLGSTEIQGPCLSSSESKTRRQMCSSLLFKFTFEASRWNLKVSMKRFASRLRPATRALIGRYL